MDQERPEQEGAAHEPDEKAQENAAPEHQVQETVAPVAASSEQEAEAGGKADLTKRFIAFIIDGAIASVVSFIPFLGGLIGAAYILTRDGFEYDFMKYRSIGKQLMKLRPVRLDGEQMTLEVSIRRNWPLAISALIPVLVIIPFLGWLLIPVAFIAAPILTITEIVLVLTNNEGRRLGDRFAKTKVIESDA